MRIPHSATQEILTPNRSLLHLHLRLIAERIQSLGGVSIAMPQDVTEMTKLSRPPRGREEVPVQISRLLEGDQTMLEEARKSAAQAAERGDDGTSDLFLSNVIRTNEAQAWFISEHLLKRHLPTPNS